MASDAAEALGAVLRMMNGGVEIAGLGVPSRPRVPVGSPPWAAIKGEHAEIRKAVAMYKAHAAASAPGALRVGDLVVQRDGVRPFRTPIPGRTPGIVVELLRKPVGVAYDDVNSRDIPPRMANVHVALFTKDTLAIYPFEAASLTTITESDAIACANAVSKKLSMGNKIRLMRELATAYGKVEAFVCGDVMRLKSGFKSAPLPDYSSNAVFLHYLPPAELIRKCGDVYDCMGLVVDPRDNEAMTFPFNSRRFTHVADDLVVAALAIDEPPKPAKEKKRPADDDAEEPAKRKK